MQRLLGNSITNSSDIMAQCKSTSRRNRHMDVVGGASWSGGEADQLSGSGKARGRGLQSTFGWQVCPVMNSKNSSVRQNGLFEV